MPKITFIIGKDQKVVDSPLDQTILQAAQAGSVPMESACGGNGFCQTCKCRIKEGAENLSPSNDREEAMGITGDERLGCQATVQGDVTVEIEN